MLDSEMMIVSSTAIAVDDGTAGDWQARRRDRQEAQRHRESGGAETALAEWQLVDRRLRTYRHHRAQLDAAELFDLARAEAMRLPWLLGHSTMLEYMEFALGYTPHVGRERLRAARALVQLPAISGALAAGQVTYSAVRELTRVATAETESEWLAAVRDKTVHEIEEMVAGHGVGDRPEDPTQPDLRERRIGLSLPPEVYALWRQARMELANERGAEITDADLVETLCRRFLNPGTGEAGPANQIAYTQCRDCKRATQNGAGREIEVSAAVFECAACDARVIGSVDGEVMSRANTTVTKRMREQVFARDHGRCRVPGCRAARNLDVHHIIAQAEGGPNELWNLLVLCSGHHKAFHDGLLSVVGRAGPYDELAIRWTYQAPWTPEEAASFREAVAEEEELAYLLRERKRPRRKRPNACGEVPRGT